MRSTDQICSGDHCVTCSDEALPMKVVAIDQARGLALCANDAGSKQTVEIALIEQPREGDELLVHAGTAIAVVSA